MSIQIRSVEDFNRALDNGPYTFPGGYPLYFDMGDGVVLSFAVATKLADRIRTAIISGIDRELIPVECRVNWDNDSLFCSVTGVRIKPEAADSNTIRKSA